MVATWGVDLPYWDQWGMVPIFERAMDRELTLEDLMPRRHDTGLAAKLPMLLLGLASGWNIRLELVLNVLLAGVLFLVTRAQLRATGSDPWPRATCGLLAALLIFSPAQQENWAWSWKLETWINVLAAVLTIVLLCSAALSPRKLVAALFTGLVASLSYINGVLIWPIGAAVLLLRRNERLKARTGYLVTWVVASAVLTSRHLSLYGYSVSTLGAPPLELASTLRYVCTFLGTPIVLDLAPSSSHWVGGAGLLLLGAAIGHRAAARLRPDVPLVWPSIAAYAIGTAAMTAVGRVSLGVDQALTSRYLTYANLLWIGLCGLLASTPRRRTTIEGAVRARRRLWAVVASVTLAVPVGIQAIGGVRKYHGQSYREEIRGALRLGVIPEHQSELLYPDPAVLEDYVSRLCRRRLSLFRYRRHLHDPDSADSCRPTWSPPGHPYPFDSVRWTVTAPTRRGEILRAANGFGAPLRDDAVEGTVRRVTRHDGVRCLAGWAVDPRRPEAAAAAAAVVVLVDGRVARATRPRRTRSKTAAALDFRSDAVGFRACLAEEDWAAVDAGAELRVLGVSARGFASDLQALP